METKEKKPCLEVPEENEWKEYKIKKQTKTKAGIKVPNLREWRECVKKRKKAVTAYLGGEGNETPKSIKDYIFKYIESKKNTNDVQEMECL